MDILFNNNRPFIEGVSVDEITKSFSTPLYIYSQKKIEKAYNNLKENLGVEIFYAVKANSNLAILKLLNNCGAGSDTVSAGEIQRSIKAGFNPNKIIYEGVGKSKEDIEYAIINNIRLINAESLNELILINKIAKNLNKTVSVGIRLNPDIDSLTLSKISTGKKTDKFGIPINELNNIISAMESLNNIKLKGLSCHVGSQISEMIIFEKVFNTMKEAASLSISKGINIEYVDLGGGFAVNYNKNINDLNVKEIGRLTSSIFKDIPYKISFEPGRYLVAKAGIIITKILNIKKNGGINFIITDAGMHTLIRPAMYNSVHQIEALDQSSNKKVNYTIAGPICESSDILAKDIVLSEQKENNFLFIHDTGAYGAAMASNYNSRGLPNELLINEDKYSIIHAEEKTSDIIARDLIPDWL